jgi:hypothetical protein
MIQATWGVGGAPKDAARTQGMATDLIMEQELATELEVSRVIGAMSVAWVRVVDPSGPASMRGTIERNAIGLLSNWSGPPMNPASSGWLGKSCDHERVTRSSLWNNNHVDLDEVYDPRFLDQMARAATATGRL